MKADDRLDNIFALARAAEADAPGIEAGFETRLMARIRAERAVRERPPWYQLSWRLVPLFTAVVLAVGVWYYTSAQGTADLHDAITGGYEYTIAQNFLSGE